MSEGREGSRIVVAVAAGVGLGVFSVLADGIIRIRAVTTLGNIIAPWAIVAFAVGRVADSARRGAAVGAVALLVGVATYYAGQAMRFGLVTQQPVSEYLTSPIAFLWLVAAVSVGPLMGLVGAVSSGRERPPIAAVVALPVVLVAEAGFLFIDRRPWLWNLPQEAYRLADLAIMVGLVAIALALPATQVGEPHRRRTAYAVLAGLGSVGVLGIIGLYRLIVALS